MLEICIIFHHCKENARQRSCKHAQPHTYKSLSFDPKQCTARLNPIYNSSQNWDVKHTGRNNEKERESTWDQSYLVMLALSTAPLIPDTCQVIWCYTAALHKQQSMAQTSHRSNNLKITAAITEVKVQLHIGVMRMGVQNITYVY